MPNIYCPFCGIILQSNQYLNPLPPTSEREWFAEIRAVFRSEARPRRASLTGVGFIRGYILSAPLDSNLSHRDTEALEAINLKRSRERSCAYGFHNSCWKLLLARLPHIKELQYILDTIFSLLFTTPCPDFAVFQFNHNYGGAAETHKPRGRAMPLDFSTPFYADPCAIPSLATLESFALDRATSLSEKWKTTRLDPYIGSSTGLGYFFGRLPLEIIYEIISYLPLVEVVGIRLVCQELALIAGRENLPQSFWKTRFMFGHEQDYIFPDLAVMRNWSQLFNGAHSCFVSGNKSLANRMRIRALLEPIAVLAELNTTKAKTPLGLPTSYVDSDEEQHWRLDDYNGEDLSMTFKDVRFFTGQLARSDYLGQIKHGCRVKRYRIARFPSQIRGTYSEGNIRQVKVSTVQIGAQCYISGIRYSFSQASSSLGNFPLELGFCTPGREKEINIPSDADVKLVEVAFCSSGLVGIRLAFAGGEDRSSPWIGQCGGQGIARGILQLPQSERNYHLVAGLDAYKIVALGLVQPNGVAGGIVIPSKEDIDPNSDQSDLWIPRVPTYKNFEISTLEPPRYSHASKVLLDIDFGGRHGVLLSSLTRIVVHMVSDPRPIIGIDVFYTDRGMRLGSGGGTEISFLIDGPGGERITSMGVTVNDPAVGVRDLQISTNYGRSMTFAGLRYFFDDSKAKLCLRPEGNNVITGFVAALAETGDYFAQLGLQSQLPEQDIITHPSPVKEDIQYLSQDELEYDQEFSVCIRSRRLAEYQTYASLTGVRRITASTGSSERSRSSCHVAGLRFDYHDHRSPTVIGQWMDEYDAMDLAQNEALQDFIIWLTKEKRYVRMPRVNQGRVVAIQVVTTHGQSKMFEPQGTRPAFHDYLKYDFQSGPQETITAISWILNSRFDRVRVIASLKTPGPPPILVPKPTVPLDQVQRFFFEEILEDGSKDKMSRIVAHFEGEIVSGLRFIYESNQSRSIGNTDTDHSQSVDIGSGELIYFSAGLNGAAMFELEFQIGSDQYLPGMPRTCKLRAPPSDGSPTQINLQDTWCMSEMSGGPLLSIDLMGQKYFPPPGARFVGIYVSCEKIYRLGALLSGSTDE